METLWFDSVQSLNLRSFMMFLLENRIPFSVGFEGEYDVTITGHSGLEETMAEWLHS